MSKVSLESICSSRVILTGMKSSVAATVIVTMQSEKWEKFGKLGKKGKAILGIESP